MENNKELLSMVETLTRHITTIGTIRISHKVTVHKNMPRAADKPPEYWRMYTNQYTAAGKQGVPSFESRDTKDYIMLSEAYPKTVEDKNDPWFKRRHSSVIMTYPDTENLNRLFHTVSEWFTGEKYRNSLFLYDKSDVPYAISSKYEGLCALTNLCTGRGQFLSAQPYVVLDALNSLGYPGVLLKCGMGPIGMCTMSEFYTLRRVVTHLMENLYTNTLCLINHFLALKGGIQKEYVIY